MEIHKGSLAISQFRAEKLLNSLHKINPKIVSIEAEYIHFIDVDGNVSVADRKYLNELLTYGSTFLGSRRGTLFLVTPRSGTISVWSSNATDIATNAGLSHIKRIERGIAYYVQGAVQSDFDSINELLHDRMRETVLQNLDAASILFDTSKPPTFQSVNVLEDGKPALESMNIAMGLALSDEEMVYLTDSYKMLKRNASDVELMMFAQLNSEHCRHKVFNANWIIDGKKQPKSLFAMIKNTNERGGQDVLSAYIDNGAVLQGPVADYFFSDPDKGNQYQYHKEPVHMAIKAETHNHPTAISPAPGAATGTGGEIRDEAATGRGAKTKMGLAGFTVSNLNIPDAQQPWEQLHGKPERLTSALGIMIEAPIGASRFANEFGRPGLSGYFRTYEQKLDNDIRGYHKPIMIAGGLGNIRSGDVHKEKLPAGSLVIALGGPAMFIGLGGGAAASMQSGTNDQKLDFASVQRGNGEMERRDQEVINNCWALGERNPIKAIHDVGAGGWSVSLPELVNDSGMGAIFELRDLPNAEPGLSPLQIWCNEAQERYVLGIDPQDLEAFTEICKRERCPYMVVGTLTKDQQLVVTDRQFNNRPIDIPLGILLGKTPKMIREIQRSATKLHKLELKSISLKQAIERVLHVPAVGSKKFLITIGDRTVGGQVLRDQMIGPWQVPVSDVAVTATTMLSETGEAMAMGERTPVALINAPASARLAIGETITNIIAADIKDLSDIKLSANWMAAIGSDREEQNLFETVQAVGEEFCPALGLTIPVGKDSLSMRTTWQDNGKDRSVTSPLSLIITGFAPVQSVKRILTPELRVHEDTVLLLIDLGQGMNRLGGSALAQAYNQLGDSAPDVDSDILKRFFTTLSKLKESDAILAYHDRSDGGLLTTLSEMAFASHSGLRIKLDDLPGTVLGKLFSEELGAVIQVKATDKQLVLETLQKSITEHVYEIGYPTKAQTILIADGKTKYEASRAQLESWWSETSYRIQKLRDNPTCAEQEYVSIKDDKDPGLSPKSAFQISSNSYKTKPKVAILREVGLNGYVEMAAAFDRAGFTSIDVHLNDLLHDKISLDDFKGLAIAGGFSYGDVLGAGEGFAKSILIHADLRKKFSRFFGRSDSFTLGDCNGCQVVAALKELIPGAKGWPAFLPNISEQFESRLVQVKINQSPSIFLHGMEGSILPVPVAHGEGRVSFSTETQAKQLLQNKLIPLQYVDHYGQVSQEYPVNPNGSPEGITSLTTPDGRVTIMMPHPERVFLTRQLSWHPKDWDFDSPWMQMFLNARAWVG